MNRHFTPLVFALFLVASCRDNPSSPPNENPAPALVKAVYVLNEGDFNDPSGARLTIYDVERDSVYRDVYEGSNGGSHLGNIGDDMRLYNGKAYIVMSGSSNLVVVNLSDNRKVSEMTFPGSSVHDLLIDSLRGRLYLTRLFSSSVYVVDLNSLLVIDSIMVGANPQGMVLSDNRIFVCNSGYGGDNTVTVIDAITSTAIAIITVSDGPTGAALAPDGKLWVVCSGNAFGSVPTLGKVFIVNPITYVKEDSISFNENLWGSIAISSDGYAYLLGTTTGSFYGGPVHRVSVSSKAISMNFVNGTYYGLGYDEVARELYISDVNQFSGNGDVRIYTAGGALRKTFAVQKGPAVFGFKR